MKAWTYRRDLNRVYFLVERQQHTVCLVDFLGNDRLDEQESRARLIAASPEMLDALQCIVSAIQTQDYPEALLIAQAAITKATGGPQ